MGRVFIHLCLYLPEHSECNIVLIAHIRVVETAILKHFRSSYVYVHEEGYGVADYLDGSKDKEGDYFCRYGARCYDRVSVHFLLEFKIYNSKSSLILDH